MTLALAQRTALGALASLWKDRHFVLVGANAIACHLEMAWRTTVDLDLSIAAEIEEYPLGLEDLTGWTRQNRGEHAWRSPEGVRIDVVPVGSQSLATGVLRWPESGNEMSVVGYRHVFASSSPLDIGGGHFIRVADLAVLALLKMISYLDRRERTHDLSDWAHIADGFVGDDDDRRFADVVFDRELAFEQVSPFTLGAALAPKLDAAEAALVDDFLRAAREPTHTRAELLRRAPLAWRSDSVGLAGRLEAFEAGLRAFDLGAGDVG